MRKGSETGMRRHPGMALCEQHSATDENILMEAQL